MALEVWAGAKSRCHHTFTGAGARRPHLPAPALGSCLHRAPAVRLRSHRRLSEQRNLPGYLVSHRSADIPRIEQAGAPLTCLTAVPAALIQGLRDNFGAHTYHRVDADGAFHTEWAGDGKEHPA